jgi:hypothetical protein
MLEGFVAAIAAYDPQYVEQFDSRRERLMRALWDGACRCGGSAFCSAAMTDSLR